MANNENNNNNNNKLVPRWQIFLALPFFVSLWNINNLNAADIRRMPEDPTQPVLVQNPPTQQQQERNSIIIKTTNEIEYSEGSFQYLNDTIKYRYSPRILKTLEGMATAQRANDKNKKLPVLFFGITSNPEKPFPRKAIRKSWAMEAPAVVFMVAGDWTDALAEEFHQYGDLLYISNMPEDYKNGLTPKTLTLFHLAATTSITQHVDYVFKTDDDVYVNATQMAMELAENEYPEYYGLSKPRHVLRSKALENLTQADRRYYEKWVMSREEYPEDLYPPHAGGVGYALSRRLTKCAGDNAIPAVFSHKSHAMPWEDVATGMLAAHCNATLAPAKWNHFIEGDALLTFPYETYKDGTDEPVQILHKVKPLYFEPLFKHEPLSEVLAKKAKKPLYQHEPLDTNTNSSSPKLLISLPSGGGTNANPTSIDSRIQIQHMYYFNSFSNPKRRAFMENWLSKQQKRNPKNPKQPFIKYKRIESISGSRTQTIKRDELVGNANTRSYDHLFWSQIELHQGQTLIFQDDTIRIQIPRYALEKYNETNHHRLMIPLLEKMVQEQNIPNDWEVIRLDCCHDDDKDYAHPKNQLRWWKLDQEKVLHLYSNTTQRCVKSNAMIYQIGVLGRLRDYVNEDITIDLDCTVPQLFRTYCVNLNMTTRNLTLQAEEPEQRDVEEAWFLQDTGQFHASRKFIEDLVRTQKRKRRHCGRRKDAHKQNHQQQHLQQQQPPQKSPLSPPPFCYPPNRHTQIDQIVYHSLEKNKLRKRLMESWLTQQRIPYKLVNAIKGGKTNCHPTIRSPERCQGVSGLIFTLLHILDHHMDANSNHTTTMVLEDDMVMVDKTMYRLKLALELLPGDWDIVRFDTWGMYEFEFQWANPLVANTSMGTFTQAPYCQDQDHAPPCTPRLFGGTYAMLLKDSSRDKLRTIWNSTKYYADADMSIALTPGIVSYSLNLGLFEHLTIRSELSDISLFEKNPT